MHYTDDWFSHIEALIKRVDSLGDNAVFALQGQADPSALRLAIVIHKERRRQSGRFTLAHRMWFTSESAQQASSEVVADYHASLFPSWVRVIDAGCGIGSDTIALARRGPVVAVDRDRMRCAMTRRNLLAHGLADHAIIVQTDVTRLHWERADWAFFDPARRHEGRRKANPADWSPSLNWIIGLADRFRGTVIKVSPTLDAHIAPSGWTVDCVGWDGVCRECLWRHGECAGPTRVQAVSLPSGQTLDAALPPPPPQPETTAWVYAPQPEVLAARATGELCRLLGGHPLSKDSQLIGSDQQHTTAFARTYRALDWFAWRERTARQAIGRLGGGIVAVKTYGVRMDAMEVARTLSHPHGRPLTLHIYRDGRRLLAVLTDLMC